MTDSHVISAGIAESALTGIFDLYGILDRQGHVREMGGRIFGRTATDPGPLVGQLFAETVYWQSTKQTSELVARSLREAADGGKVSVVVDFRISAEEKVPMELTLLPIAQEPETVFAGGRVLTDERERVLAHKKGREELLFVAGNADIGLWYWNFVEDEIYSTPRCNELLGLPPYEPLSPSSILEAVHPEDRGAFESFLNEAQNRNIQYEEEFRVAQPGGTIQWICVEGRSVPDADGKPGKMMGVVRNITDQKRAADELAAVYERERRARDEAVEANRAKDLFLAFVSHELRAPLNAILGWSKILLTKSVDDETRRTALETIERSARSQAKLINDLVDSARVASGRIKLEYHPTDLITLLRGTCQAMEPEAQARNVKLEIVTDLDRAMVFGDTNRLQQVFGNLISNAIKFTPQGGSITISAESDGPFVRVAVEDNGQGIDPNSLPRIFVQGSTAHPIGGRGGASLGLGLSIARKLVEKHKGSIEAESAGLGKGSKFTVTLPMIDPSDPDANRSVENVPKGRPLEGASILVVEDDADSREVLVLFLEQNGVRVVAAPNARTAYSMLTGSTGGLPDVIISDLGMPEEDGYSLMTRIRRLPPEQGGNVPAIVVSAFATNESRAKAFEAGFQRYTTKPFEPETLIKEILGLIRPQD